MARPRPSRPLRGACVLGLLAATPAMAGASAADLRGPSGRAPAGIERGVLATCEDLGQFCFAEGCGRDQIDAALSCRAACPSSVVMTLQPAACPLAPTGRPPVLRRGG